MTFADKFLVDRPTIRICIKQQFEAFLEILNLEKCPRVTRKVHNSPILKDVPGVVTGNGRVLNVSRVVGKPHAVIIQD